MAIAKFLTRSDLVVFICSWLPRYLQSTFHLSMSAENAAVLLRRAVVDQPDRQPHQSHGSGHTKGPAQLNTATRSAPPRHRDVADIGSGVEIPVARRAPAWETLGHGLHARGKVCRFAQAQQDMQCRTSATRRSAWKHVRHAPEPIAIANAFRVPAGPSIPRANKHANAHRTSGPGQNNADFSLSRSRMMPQERSRGTRLPAVQVCNDSRKKQQRAKPPNAVS